MKIHIEFNTDNDTTHLENLKECEKILRSCQDFIEAHLDRYAGHSIRGLFDIDGNRIGQLDIDDATT